AHRPDLLVQVATGKIDCLLNVANALSSNEYRVYGQEARRQARALLQAESARPDAYGPRAYYHFRELCQLAELDYNDGTYASAESLFRRAMEMDPHGDKLWIS